MSNISIKKEEEEVPEEKPVAEPKKEAPREPSMVTDFSFFLNRDYARKWLPFAFFLFLLAVTYISFQHYAEGTVRDTEKINREINELRSEDLTTKAQLMNQSKQTTIAKRLEETGVKELREPPVKISNNVTQPQNKK